MPPQLPESIPDRLEILLAGSNVRNKHIRSHEQNHTRDYDTLTCNVFCRGQLVELTNVFGWISGTCPDPNHIKACVCVDVAGEDPQIWTAINQGSYNEGKKELERCSSTLRDICQHLAKINEGNKNLIREQIAAIILRDAWSRICLHLGMTCKAPCSNDESSKTHKVFKPSQYIPDKLDGLVEKLKDTGDGKFLQAMKDLSKELRDRLGPHGTTHARSQSSLSGDNPPDGTDVCDDHKVKALFAIYKFYNTHQDDLRAASSKDCIRRFENLAHYVGIANFLCNLALGHASVESKSQDNRRIIKWFKQVKVEQCKLEETVFRKREGDSEKKKELDHHWTWAASLEAMCPQASSFVASEAENKKFKEALDQAQSQEPLPKIHAEVTLAYALSKIKLRMTPDGGQGAGSAPGPVFCTASSKKACFNCDHFLRVCTPHVISLQSHEKSYPAWCLPDLSNVKHKFLKEAVHWPHAFCSFLERVICEAHVHRERAGDQALPAYQSEDIELKTVHGVAAAYNWNFDSAPAQQGIKRPVQVSEDTRKAIEPANKTPRSTHRQCNRRGRSGRKR